MRTPSQTLKDRWLEAALPLVESAGWNRETLNEAARDAGLSSGEQALAAPGGTGDLIDHFFANAGATMLQTLAAQDLAALRTHERVAAGLKAWLAALEPSKGAVAKAAARGMLPWGAGAATRRVWALADTIWEAAGDTATDYNRQTKRALLSAVIPSVVLRWLSGADEAEMDQFIERRLQQAMRLGRAGGKVIGPILDGLSRVKRPE